MKIGIFDPYLDTMSGGEKYMLSIATCLADKHEVTLFWDKDRIEEVSQKAKDRFDIDLSNLTFVDSIFSPHISFFSRFQNSKDYDYIVCLSDGSIPFVACKLILHFQSPMPWLKPSIKTKIKLNRVKTVVCNSQFTKSFIDKSFHIDSKVIYPPISLQKVENVNKESIILHVGRYGINHAGSSYKKQEVLVSAFKKLVDAGVKDWKLVLVVSVSNQDEEKLKELKKSCGNYPIDLIVNPTNENLWREYAMAKIYWHASGFGENVVVHPDRAEHFGMSTVEAMGMGAVPIVIAAGGQKEIVKHEESGFLWSDEEELLDFTKKVITQEDLWEKLSTAAKSRAVDFSLEKFCQGFSNIIT